MAVADDAERLREMAEREGLKGGDFLRACAHVVAEAAEAVKAAKSAPSATSQGQATHPMNAPDYSKAFGDHVERHAEAEKVPMNRDNAVERLFGGKK